MSDPVDLASKAAKVAKLSSAAVDLASDGALRDLCERIMPDVDAKLRGAVAKANEDMFLAVLFVVRALLAKALGRDPSAPEVAEEIRKATLDPAFGARAARLLAESIRSPSEARRRLLALALFRPNPDPEMRDLVDAALGRLWPPDVELLSRLAAKDDGHGLKLVAEGTDAAGAGWALAGMRTLDAIPNSVRATRDRPREAAIPCRVASLFALSTGAQCIEMFDPPGLASIIDLGLVIRNVHVLPLGREVVRVLEEKRAALDIDASAKLGEQVISEP
jgi:hypothetical protein